MVRAEVNQELSGALDLRGAALDLQAERVSLLRLQEAQDPGRATFSLGSPLYLNLFPVRCLFLNFTAHSCLICGCMSCAGPLLFLCDYVRTYHVSLGLILGSCESRYVCPNPGRA